MKVLCSVGTTSFDKLTYALDSTGPAENEYIFQIAAGRYRPHHGNWFRFGEIESHYEWADLIVTHAGAGSVYSLLERRKQLLIVPNLTRRDPHQRELARYVEKMRYALVCWDFEKIGSLLEDALKFKAEVYERIPFFKFEEISNLIKNASIKSAK